jgi:hypothetical protein
MNINELKAHAYDCIAQIEYWTMESKKANQAIAEYFKKEEEAKNVAEAVEEKE